MEKSSKNLKEKVLFLMCLGALAGNISTEIYAQNNVSVLDFSTSGIEAKKVKKEYNDTDLIINKKDGYALYSECHDSSGIPTASIIINKESNNKNIVQIIGNIKASAQMGASGKDYTYSSTAKIELNLSNSESYFAGRMETYESKVENSEANASIEMNLKDKATWYAHNSNGKDEYDISSKDESFKTLITSDGGVIDVYHTAPDESPLQPTSEQLNKVKELEIYIGELFGELKDGYILGTIDEEMYQEGKQKLKMMFAIEKAGILGDAREKGERTFTLNGVGDRLQNTTFRISTDVENKKSDKIVLNGIEVKKDSETYFIEIAADPFKIGEWKADKDGKILVMDINGNGLDKITVEGKECEAEIGAGLVKQKIIPTVEEDTANKGDWYLTSIDKIESKGSGHIFAEIGAAANAGMASAWRTDSGDLYQRMGNLRNNEAEQGVWGRIYTGENEIRKGIGLDLEYRAVQVGYDRKQNIDGGKLFTGIAFGYFDGNTDYDHGSGESNSATVGMYATYSGNNGSFGDFIVKLGNIDNKLSYTSESGDYYKADYDTYGFSADAEYGYRYELNNDYYIEPLAQLSYIYIADEEYTMNLNGESGAKVSNDDYQSLIGYAGFHYGKKFGDNVAYLRVAAAHEFAGDIDVDARYQDIKVNSSISGEDTWVEYGVGFDVKVKEDTAVYGRLQKSTGDVVKNKWHASVGIRYTF